MPTSTAALRAEVFARHVRVVDGPGGQSNAAGTQFYAFADERLRCELSPAGSEGSDEPAGAVS